MNRELPNGWHWSTVEAVAASGKYSIVDGPFGSNLKLTDYVSTGIPVLQGKNITNNAFKWFDVRYISKQKADEIKRSSVTIGDVLIVKIGSIGYSAILNDLNGCDFAIIPANLAKVTLDTDIIDRRFFHLWMTSPDVVRLLKTSASKTAQPALSLSKIKAVPIPLPPLVEQKRIVAILDKADAIRCKRQEALSLANTFLRSVFLKMFGDPVTNDMGWDEVLLKNVASIGSGVTKGKKYKELKLVEVPYMRVANVQDGWIDTTDMKSISVSPSDVARFSMKKGDLLLTEGGDPDKLGRGAVWDGSISPCIHQNHIFKVRFDTSSILPEFASFLIGSNRGKRYFLCAAKQTTGIATINKTQLSNFKMLVPNMKLQQQFSDTVLRAKGTWKKLEQLADVSNNIFSSLQQRAFRGDL